MLASVRSWGRRLAAVTLIAALVSVSIVGVPPWPGGSIAPAGATPVPDEPPTVVVTTPRDLELAPAPNHLTPVGEFLLFSANHPSYGTELWRVGLDGNDPALVADLVPGTNSSFPSDLVLAGDQVLFTAFGSGVGRELWRSDGTSEGTELVADIKPGSEPSRINHLTALGDLVVFFAEDGVHGSEPWVSDGTPSGTRMLQDINPGSSGSGAGPFAVVGDEAYFEAFDPIHGSELWATDGTPQGTRLVADINPGPASSRPLELTAFGDRVAFRADDGVSGSELWISDGTTSGTRQVADIREGDLGSGIEEMLAVGSRLFFRANDGVHGRELWASDGNIAYLVKDIVPGFTGGVVNQVTMPQRFTALGDRGVVFVADMQLWVSDGTTAGTTMLAEILPGDSTLITALPDELTSIGNQVVFGADDGVHGREPWITDGTSAGTRLLADLNPGSAGSYPRRFTEAGDTVFFIAVDADRDGFELWSWVPPAVPQVDDPTATFDGVELTLTFPGPLERPDPVTRTRLRVTADGTEVSVLGRDWSASEPDLIVLAILGGIDPDADVRVSYEPRLSDTPLRYADGVEVPPFTDVPATYTRFGWVVATSGMYPEVSLDGQTWQQSTDPAFGEFSTYRVLTDDGRGTWLAASRSNSGDTFGRASIRRSPDGVSWSEPTAMGIPGQVFAIEPVPGGGWLGVGDRFNMLMASPDGTTWTALPDPIATPVSLSSLTHDGAGRWVAVGDDGTILVSDDGGSWEQVGIEGEPDFDRQLRAVAHGDGRWVAVADTAVLTSTDGRVWSRVEGPFGTMVPRGLRGLLHDGDGRWLLWSSIALHTSVDGLDWELARSGSSSYTAAGHHGGQWVVAVQSSIDSCLHTSVSDSPFGFWQTGCTDRLARSIRHGALGVPGATPGDEEDPFKPSLALAALEVNQVVQDWEGSVPLVAEKATVVRAHFDRVGSPVTLSGRLHGRRDGQALAFSPLSPINDEAQAEVVGSAEDGRADPGSTLNFMLPPWWTTGDVELRFEPHSVHGLECQEAWAPAETCTAEVSFEPTREVDIRFVRSGRHDYAGPEVGWLPVPAPAVSDMPEQTFRLMDQIPTHFVTSTETSTLPYRFKPSTMEVLTDVRSLRILDGCTHSDTSADTCTTHYYGVLGGTGSGRGYQPGGSSMGYTNDTEARSATGFGRQMIGHEVGHNLGLRHTPMPGPVTDDDGDLVGRCTSTAPADTPIHPYDEEVRPDLFRPAIGPLGDPQTEIWGASPRFFGNDDRFAVIDPRETFALMSYCWQGGMQDAWISVDHYLDVFADFTGGNTPAATGSVSAGPSDGGRLLVAGSVDLADGSAQLDPIWPLLDGAAPELIVTGEHQLRLSDTDGTVLLEQPFGFDEAGPHGDERGSVRSFVLDLPEPEQPIARLEVLDPTGTPLASLDAGMDPLGVRVTSPTAGTVFDGDEVTVTWELEGPEDETEVSYVVQHSADDGATWTTLALGTTETSLTFDRSDLAGTPQARLRVLASADLRTAAAVSDRFEIAGNAPMVTIDRPADGLVVRPTQQVTVVAVAHDPEDGQLDGEQMRWISDVDGDLGTGGELSIPPWGLSLGTHELMVTATDRDGQVASTSITVQVGIPPVTVPFDEGDDPPDDGSGPPGPGGPDEGTPGDPPRTDDGGGPPDGADGDGRQDPTLERVVTPELIAAICADVSTDAPFTDVTGEGAHDRAITCALTRGLVRGYGDGTYRSLEPMTRGQAATVLAAVADELEVAPRTAGQAVFPDTLGSVHREAIERLAAAGIVRGFADGTFRPGESVSRGQFASMLMGLHTVAAGGRLVADSPAGFTDTAGSVHAEAIDAAAAVGLARGVSTARFEPGEPVGRGQVATLGVRLLAWFIG